MKQPMHVIQREYYNLNPEGHWFDASSMRFFKCRLPDYGYNKDDSTYFISSEQGPSMPRLYTVRRFDRISGSIETIGPFNELTRTEARRLLAKTINYKIKDL